MEKMKEAEIWGAGDIVCVSLKNTPDLYRGVVDSVDEESMVLRDPLRKNFITIKLDDIYNVYLRPHFDGYGAEHAFYDEDHPIDPDVNHPNHYQSSSGLECRAAIEACTEHLSGMEAVNVSNIVKYIWRWKKKNGLKDLKKAKDYLDDLIDRVIKSEKEND